MFLLNPMDDICAICLNLLNTAPITTTPCRHRFHHDCLMDALRYHSTCPLCRRELTIRHDDDYVKDTTYTLWKNNLADVARRNHFINS